jgi:hypothetical protein
MSNRFKTLDPTKDVELAAVAPCPVLIFPGVYGELVADDLDMLALCYAIESVRAAKRFLQYRGVALDRLPTVLRSGCDVEPADRPFWSAERIEKALEYGGREQLLLVYDPRRLTPAWVIIDADCPASKRADLERLYPTVVWENGESTKLSRLPPSEYHGGIGYDHYAHWIPDDPFEALLMIIAIARPEYPLISEVRRMISECRKPEWRIGPPEERAAILRRATDTTRLRLAE